MSQASAHAQGNRRVQRQIVLPLSKAIEIAWRSIRMRLSRSLLVTSGIVLALAFLMTIEAKEALVSGMRQWSHTAAGQPAFAELRHKQAQLETQLKDLANKTLLPGVDSARSRRLEPGTPVIDPKITFGSEMQTLQKDLGTLPAPAESLIHAMSLDAKLIDAFKAWLDLKRQQKQTVEELTGPQNLEAMLKDNGEAVSGSDVQASLVQTHWLLGLALLVAFVGILNAMLMSVTERFREIGTMKCLGALDSFIVKLFLIESLFQGVVGAAVGVAIGLVLSILSVWTTYQQYAWKNPQWHQLGRSVAVCFAVGVGLTVCGAVYPAWQAARMQPIEAMRVQA